MTSEPKTLEEITNDWKKQALEQAEIHEVDMTPKPKTDEVEGIVLEAGNRLSKFEHEPSRWHGMMVYEAGDIDGFLDWLRTTLQTQADKAERERERGSW